MNDNWFVVRKKPVEVEASGPHFDTRTVETLEGDFEVTKEYADGGYYLIRGVEGEIYPCEAEIFESTYERL